ncbi:ESPR-type extended signal peptide-containing protein [Stenotrophomonas muris]|uniref:ESPR-type extended signal peptide-containing protein n=1 Tax=Stenotrophomonas muris TaxID=2963283 RepID=UPI00383A8E6B
MNRIYRRIWSAAKQCWVVGSELSSPRGKSAGGRALLLVAALVGLPAAAHEHSEEVAEGEREGTDSTQLLLPSPWRFSSFSNQVNAGYTQLALVNDSQYRNATISGDMQMILGSRSSISGWGSVVYGTESSLSGLGSVLVGNSSIARGDRNVVVGYGSEAKSGYATVVGASSIASGIGATALGHDARAYASNSIAVGSGARTVESSAGVSRIAIGGNAFAGTAGYSGAIALGGNARAEYSGVALGHHAKASAHGSIAIGAYSEATESNSVSVGSSSTKRRVTNVDDARLNASSTDAVTGKQLHATNSNVAAARSVADSAKTNADSALAKANVISGLLSQTSASGNVRLGASNSGTVLDVRNSANASRKITGVADATLSTTSTEAVSGKQLNATNTNVTAARSVADSAKTNADSALAKANTLSGLLSQTSASGNIRIGASNSGTALDVRNSASANRKITGVADATLSTTSTDAVSGKQLNATNTKLADAQRVADAAAARLSASAPAIGLAAEAEGSGSTASVAMGRSAKAYNTNSIAVGADARASVDANGDKSAATGAVALGAATRSGNGAVAAGLRASAVGDRAVAVGNDATAAATHAAALGYKANASGNQAVAIGREAAASGLYSTALGNLAKAGAESAIALGDRALASHTGSVALGNASQTTGINQVSVGSSSIKRKIVNLADGAVSSSTEAITGKQLNETNGRVTTAQNAANGAQTTANAAQVDASKALSEATVLGGLVGQVSATGIVRLGEKNSGTVVDVRNSANANRKLTGVADGVVSASSYEVVNGRQLNATNEKVGAVEGMATSAAADATLAKADAAKALAETAVLGGLVAQVSASGDVRLGEKNSGTTLNVRNSANANRKISGVADGALSAGSAEAVSGRQLYSSNARIAALEDTTQFLSIGTAPASERAEAGPVGVAVGNSAKTGNDGGTAVGTHAKALGRNSVAIGRASVVHEDSDSGFALGAGAEVGIAGSGARGGVAIGAGAKVGEGADGSLALGEGSQANEAGVASFGSATTYRRLVNIARGTADHNATTVSQLKESLATLGGGAGMDANGNIIAPIYSVQSGTQNTVEDALMALDGAVVSTTSRVNQVESQLRSVFQETPSVRADGTHQLTLAGANGMVISNVANGLIAAGSRDAVNGGQLHSMQQQINGRMDGLEQRIDGQPQARAMAAASTPSPFTEDIAPAPETSGSPQIASTGEGDKPTPQPKPKQDDTPKPQVDTADLEKMLARANEYTDGAISTFERRLDKMDKRFNRMAAMSSAQSAMAMNTAGLATYNRLGAGVGYSEGESAMAVGYQRVLNEKGSATFSLNGAFTNSGERSMGVGVGIGW